MTQKRYSVKRRPRETHDDNEESRVTVRESVSDKLRSANEFLTRLAEQFGYIEP